MLVRGAITAPTPRTKGNWKIFVTFCMIFNSLIVAGMNEIANDSTNVVNLTSENFDVELSKRPHMVMFFIPK